MAEIRVLPEQQPRVETAPVQFGQDWPGIFIRGDQACYWSQRLLDVLEHAKRGGASFIELQPVVDLQNLLTECATGVAREVIRKTS